MLRNYLVTALRNLWRKKGTTILNIGGLSVGVAGCLVLFILITHHNSYDKFHSKADRIYRVATRSIGNNQEEGFTTGVPAVLPEAFKNDFPEAEEVVFTGYRSGSLITVPQPNGIAAKKFSERQGVVFTQPSYFKVFDRPVIIGDGAKALDDPNEAVISRKLAMKYFGKLDAIGEVITYDNRDYKIGAVAEDYGNNTDFPFDLMLSHITVKKELDDHGWGSIWSDEQCWFLLREGASIADIEARIPDFVKKYRDEEDAGRSTNVIQPLRTVHSDERFGNYNYNTIPNSVLLALTVVAIFLVITACINFINLATAEAIKRSKEVGIRKSLGSTRAQLIRQFLGETTLVTVFSMMTAIGIVFIGLKFLNPFIEQELQLNLAGNPELWMFLIGLTIVVSVLSGLYPSFVMSAFRPALALKSAANDRNSTGFHLRRVLVVTQFFISQLFIIATIVLINQMDFLNNAPLGFRKEAIVTVDIPVSEDPNEQKGVSKMRTLRGDLERIAGVEIASLNDTPPSSGSVSGTRFRIEGSEERYGTQVKSIDGNYLELFELELVAGEKIGDLDTAMGFLVNERLAAIVGYNNPTEILGKQISMWGMTKPIVGVLKDFHTVSLSNPITPVILFNNLGNYHSLSMKINSAAVHETIKQVQQRWETSYPDAIFSHTFLEEDIRSFYDSQRRMSVLLSIFTSIAIFIGCLGLVGLVTFMANQKTKEIGVRKVLGASVQNILVIFSREFVVLILIGFLIAAPVAWYIMNRFLDEFAYKITIGPGVFATGIGVTVVLALLTVGYRSVRAALANPVNSLRSE
jgi:ABC-type antimicrobial peptide transport system permease subunit